MVGAISISVSQRRNESSRAKIHEFDPFAAFRRCQEEQRQNLRACLIAGMHGRHFTYPQLHVSVTCKSQGVIQLHKSASCTASQNSMQICTFLALRLGWEHVVMFKVSNQVLCNLQDRAHWHAWNTHALRNLGSYNLGHCLGAPREPQQ